MRILCRFSAAALLAATLALPSPAQDGQPPTLELGSPAPDFALPGTDGRTYTLADFADADVLAIVFTTNHCPTAQAYEGRLKALVDDYADRGVAVVAISPNDPLAVRLDELGYSDLNDSLEEMKLRAEAEGFNFPYLYDGETQATSRAYGPVATPHAFVFDGERRLRYVGRIDDDEDPSKTETHDLRDALDALLEGEAVPVAQTKTFGCSVKWADKRSSAQASLDRWAQEPVALAEVGLDEVRAIMRNETDNLRMVNVWATWCGPCIAEMPALVEMHRMYRGRDFELVTISADEPEAAADALEVLREHEASMRNVHFTAGDTYDLIEAVDEAWPGALPYTVLLAPGGEVVYRQVGEIDPLALKRAVVGYLGRTYFATPGG